MTIRVDLGLQNQVVLNGLESNIQEPLVAESEEVVEVEETIDEEPAVVGETSDEQALLESDSKSACSDTKERRGFFSRLKDESSDTKEGRGFLGMHKDESSDTKERRGFFSRLKDVLNENSFSNKVEDFIRKKELENIASNVLKENSLSNKVEDFIRKKKLKNIASNVLKEDVSNSSVDTRSRKYDKLKAEGLTDSIIQEFFSEHRRFLLGSRYSLNREYDGYNCVEKTGTIDGKNYTHVFTVYKQAENGERNEIVVYVFEDGTTSMD